MQRRLGSRSSALLSRRRGCLFAGAVTMGIPPLTSSTPRRRITLRRFIRDQFVRPVMTSIGRRGYLYATITAKPPGNVENGFALALPHLLATCRRQGCRTGGESRSKDPRPTPLSYTCASACGGLFAAACAVGLPFLARRTDLLDIGPDDAVLEIGTGLG